MRFLLGFSALLLVSGFALADTVGGNGTFNALPGSLGTSVSGTQGTPFWNNFSMDTTTGCAGCVAGQMNVGQLLTQTGNFSAGNLNINVLGGASVASDYTTTDTASDPGDPTSFNFVRNATAYQVSLLFADSSLNESAGGQITTQIGIFDETTHTTDLLYSDIEGVSNGMTVGPTGTQAFPNINNGHTYELYSVVCYARPSLPALCNTYFSDTGATPNTGNATSGLKFNGSSTEWNHFALFQLANGAGYAIGFEDSNSNLSPEGAGDFNDIVIEFQAIPEPGTIAFMGLGLAGLGLLGRRRFAKN
jgi:hypothetical protein